MVNDTLYAITLTFLVMIFIFGSPSEQLYLMQLQSYKGENSFFTETCPEILPSWKTLLPKVSWRLWGISTRVSSPFWRIYSTGGSCTASDYHGLSYFARAKAFSHFMILILPHVLQYNLQDQIISCHFFYFHVVGGDLLYLPDQRL